MRGNKKRKDAGFRYRKTHVHGIKVWLRMNEALALIEMLRPYAEDMWLDKKMSITDQVIACNCTEVYQRLEKLMLIHRDLYEITLTRAQALAFYEEVFTTRLFSRNLAEKMVMQNIFSAIDKTLL